MTSALLQYSRTKLIASGYKQFKDAGLSIGIITGLLFLNQLIDPFESHEEYLSFALILLAVTIVEVGGRSFDEFKNTLVSHQWLMLPVSRSVQWWSNFLNSFLVVPIVALLGLSLCTMFINTLLWATGWGQTIPVFNPVSAEAWFCLKVYWLAHPALFLGASWFNKRSVMKALFFVAGLFIAYCFWAGYNLKWIFSGLFETWATLEENGSHTMTFDFEEEDDFTLLGENIQLWADELTTPKEVLIRGLLYSHIVIYVLGCWGISYQRLKEREQ